MTHVVLTRNGWIVGDADAAPEGNGMSVAVVREKSKAARPKPDSAAFAKRMNEAMCDLAAKPFSGVRWTPRKWSELSAEERAVLEQAAKVALDHWFTGDQAPLDEFKVAVWVGP